jgi:hypothetical protein
MIIYKYVAHFARFLGKHATPDLLPDEPFYETCRCRTKQEAIDYALKHNKYGYASVYVSEKTYPSTSWKQVDVILL